MSLKTKITFIVICAFALFVVVDYAILAFVIQPKFVALDITEAENDSSRVKSAIEHEQAHLKLLCTDWSNWDDTFKFVQSRDPAYVESNLVDSTFVGNQLNLICFINSNGDFVWKRSCSLPDLEKIDFSGFDGQRLSGTLLRLFNESFQKGFRGLWPTSHGMMLLSVEPVTTSDKKSPVKGMLAMGRLITKDLLSSISNNTKVKFEIKLIPSNAITAEQMQALYDLENDEGKIITNVKRGTREVVALLRDLSGKSAAILITYSKRDIVSQGDTATGYAMASTLTAAFLILGLFTILLNRTVIGPLSKLTYHVMNMAGTELASDRLDLRNNDEFGLLGREFDNMVARLADVQTNMVEQSYYSGQADMNAGVLHNIGNALSPIIVRISEGLERLRTIPLTNIQAANKELATGALDSTRRAQLNEYLNLANAEIIAMVPALVEEHQKVLAGIKRIENILADSHFKHSFSRPIENIRLDQLTREALGMTDPALRNWADFRLGQSLVAVGPIRSHRVPLMQIMCNLLSNAAESIKRAGNEDGFIEVNASLEENEGVNTVHIMVRDNGYGISGSGLQQLFQRGVSSKGVESAGLGLHWSANAASSLGGRLYAESAGVGHGAVFHLLLPISSSPGSELP